MMWDLNDHMSGWQWAFMGIGVLAFWAVVVTALVLVVRALGRPTPPPPEPTAAEILARRFARGEITEDEFLTRSKLVKH